MFCQCHCGVTTNVTERQKKRSEILVWSGKCGGKCTGDRGYLAKNKRCLIVLPNNNFVAFLQTQALHSENDSLQCSWQGVGEGDLGCHLLTNHGFSQRLPGRNSKLIRICEVILHFLGSRVNKILHNKILKNGKNAIMPMLTLNELLNAKQKLTMMLRSGVRSLKVVWLANTCWVSLTLPVSVSIRAAWSTSWFWYCW